MCAQFCHFLLKPIRFQCDLKPTLHHIRQCTTPRMSLKELINFSGKTQHDTTRTFGARDFAKFQYALQLLISQAGVIGEAMMRKGIPALLSHSIIIRRRLGTGARGSNL